MSSGACQPSWQALPGHKFHPLCIDGPLQNLFNGSVAQVIRGRSKANGASPASASSGARALTKPLPKPPGLAKTKRKAKPKTQYFASIHPGKDAPLPGEFVGQLAALENTLGMPLWFVIHHGGGKAKCDEIGPHLAAGFLRAKGTLPENRQIALLLHSPGGYPRNAYQIANLIRKHCGGFKVVVPLYAKSAATLLALGGESILLGEDAELGPLDAQTVDPGREEILSALDEVQSVERLFASSLDAVDQTMQLLVNRTGKKVDTLLAPVLHFVAEMMSPLFEKIDTVHYTQYSRVLKVAEEYAIRLLTPRYSLPDAKTIARHLVERYPEHGFVVDSVEASKIGLKTDAPTSEQTKIMEKMAPFLISLTASGKLERA